MVKSNSSKDLFHNRYCLNQIFKIRLPVDWLKYFSSSYADLNAFSFTFSLLTAYNHIHVHKVLQNITINKPSQNWYTWIEV